MSREHGAPAADAGEVARGRPAALNDLLLAGIAAGLLAGAAMLAWTAVAAAVADLSPLRSLEMAAGTFTGGEPVDAGPAALVSGGLLWVVVSVALALIFAVIIPRDFPFVSAALIGIGYSFLVMAVVTSVALPRVNPLMRAAMAQTGGAWVLAYAVFGIMLGFVPVFRRRLVGRS